MIHKDNDLRWLIKSDEPLEVKINDYTRLKLNRFYQEIILQFNNLKAPLVKKKIQIVIKVIDFVIKSLETKDIQRLENASIIMRGLLTTYDPDVSWLYDVDIAETPSQRETITELAVKIHDYNAQKEKEKSAEKTTLEKETARICNTLGITIDTKIVDVRQFMAFKNEAIDKIKLSNG